MHTLIASKFGADSSHTMFAIALIYICYQEHIESYGQGLEGFDVLLLLFVCIKGLSSVGIHVT